MDGITVAELIGKLLREDMDSIVVCSVDAEGNSFKPLCKDVTNGRYEPDSKTNVWFGDIIAGEPNAVVLWPIN